MKARQQLRWNALSAVTPFAWMQFCRFKHLSCSALFPNRKGKRLPQYKSIQHIYIHTGNCISITPRQKIALQGKLLTWKKHVGFLNGLFAGLAVILADNTSVYLSAPADLRPQSMLNTVTQRKPRFLQQHLAQALW